MIKLQSDRPVPFLILSDAPDSPTGLGRIGHDLAWLLSSMPELKVGYLGRGSFGRSRFPWTSYSFPESGQWGEGRLQEAWEDLAGDSKGIIFTCWDASRLLWFADGRGTGLESFLNSGRFERWGYFMADGAGPDSTRLPLEQAHVISRYDRALMASQWACALAQEIQGPELDWMPHPINRDTFKRGGREEIRSAWGLAETDILLGCVMTNQARKHWPVVMEAVAGLGAAGIRVRLWVHTDLHVGYWNLQALAVEYGIGAQVITEGRPLRDRELAMRYSACDVTVVVSGGEGFCYPVAESLSCGTPAVTGSYGAQAELTHWLVEPAHTVIETNHNVRRAVYRAGDVANKIMEVLAEPPEAEECEYLAAHLDMMRLGICWKKWLRKGLA
jgi:glycosyltransferase involved in cell wall biosynthesis